MTEVVNGKGKDWGGTTTAPELPAWWKDFSAALEPHTPTLEPHELADMARRAMRKHAAEMAEAAPVETPQAHKDNTMLDAFFPALRDKLALARRLGRGGWDDAELCNISYLWLHLVRHAYKPNLDFVDTAAFSGMLWYRLTVGPQPTEDRARLLAHIQEERAGVFIKHREFEAVAGVLKMLTGKDPRSHDWAELSRDIAAQYTTRPEIRAYRYQADVTSWLLECFGERVAADMTERTFRFFEEAAELCQSLGMTEEEGVKLLSYTFSREKGEVKQEVGGVMVTLTALCAAAEIGLEECANAELVRVWRNVDKIRAKHAAKPEGVRTPLPGIVPQEGGK